MVALKISPSKAALISECPGAARMSAPYKWETSEAATRGSNLHDAMALLFQTGTAAFANIKVNPLLAQDDIAVLPEVFKLGLSQKPSDPKTLVIVEEAVDCKFMNLEGGKPDLVFLSETQKVAVIIDWKFGARPVEDVSKNKQLIAYACAYLAKHPWLETVETVIIQPFGNASDWASTHTWTKAELRTWAKVLLDSANAARLPSAPCVAGGHCFSMFCSARKDGETTEGAPITACTTYVAYKQRIADGKADEKASATAELVRPGLGVEVIDSTQLSLTQALESNSLDITVSPDAPITGPFYIATADTISRMRQKSALALELRVTDQSSAEIAGRMRIDMMKDVKLVKENRETLNAPILKLQRAMMAREKEVTDPSDTGIAHLAKQLESWTNAENARKAAAYADELRKQREAEAARQAAERESQRKTQEAIEQARKAEELALKAAEASSPAAKKKAEKAAAEAQAKADEALRQAEEEEEKRKVAERQAEQSAQDQQALLAPQAKVAGFRMTEEALYTIPDYSKVPKELMEIVFLPNDKTIKAMLKTGALNETKHGAWLSITRGSKAVGSR